ncbi:helix-turn-helix domain-containing protein [Limosilactobacillus allomucosae]|uniref:Helix-turn-helix domain-containing protein n=1 Tax=Limosilactobacillus allomucosae TaxID=3142938 RepID=A0AAU7C633_9LACO
METIQEILQKNNLTQSDVARASGISLATINQAIKKPVSSWSIRILNAIAEVLHQSPGKLLDRLQKSQYSLEINDQYQTIQGVKINDLELYQNIRFVVQNNVLEGWEPTTEDILFLVDSAEHPDPKLEKEYQEIFGNDQ